MDGPREKGGEENKLYPHNFILRSLDKPEKFFLKVPSTRLSLHSSNTPNSFTSHLSFNQDQNPYTPAFVERSKEEALCFTSFTIQSQQTLCRRPEPLRHRAGEVRTRKTMLLPEPNSKYCSVCRENFQNYFSHINHPVHLRKAEESEGSRYIRDLVDVIKVKALKEEKSRLGKGRTQSFNDPATTFLRRPFTSNATLNFNLLPYCPATPDRLFFSKSKPPVFRIVSSLVASSLNQSQQKDKYHPESFLSACHPQIFNRKR